MISSLLYIIWYDQVAAIIVGRILAGFAHGFTYIALVSHAAENAASDYRGRCLASINTVILFGIFAFTILQYSSLYMIDITGDRLIGICALAFSVVAMIFTPFFTYESSAFLLSHGRDEKALRTMIVLRSETIATWTINNDFQEMKMMVNEDQMHGRNIFADGNVSPLLIMCGVKLLAFLTNNRLVNMAQILVGIIVLRSMPVHITSVILVSSRLLVSLVTLCITDLLPRRLQLIISGALSGSTLILFGILAVSLSWFASSSYALVAVFIAFQCFASFGLDPLQDILMGEAFSLRKRIWSIVFITVFENMLHVIFLIIYAYILLDETFVYGVTFTMAALILIVSIVLYIILPETLNLTLRQARAEFSSYNPRITIQARVASSNF